MTVIVIPTDKHIGFTCHACRKETVKLTKTFHHCSPACAKATLNAYWKDRWIKRKHDPVAKEAVRRAKKKYNAKKE